ncbi:hypothetical protein [Paraburkholderia fungorum]|uniref:hypothetical protein n=1 Tax=Paraburkholderia fungorum TaxID=134537 RepID=UPI0038BD67CA
MGASRKSTPILAERPVRELGAAAPATADILVTQIAAALDEAGGNRLPVYATLGDALVRYFIVTPPGNSARLQDLRAAAAVRFQVLYGESITSWQIVADWQATAPFLACAVPQRLCTALELAVATQRGTLVSVVPDFVAAWNRSRRHLGADVWLATLSDGALTLGLVVANTGKPRLAAVRTLVLPDAAPSLDWLREQVARAALLDNVPAPAVLYVHGPQIDGWSTGSTAMNSASASLASGSAVPASSASMTSPLASPASASSASASSASMTSPLVSSASTGPASLSDTGMRVRWCAPGNMPPVAEGSSASTAAQLAWGGVSP